MAEALVLNRKLLGAQAETTKGTANAPTGPLANSIIYNAVLQPDDIYSDGQRRPNRGSTGTLPRVQGMQTGTLTFRTPLIPGDDTLGVLLPACGFSSDANPVPSSDQSAHDTLSFALWEAGRKKILYGAMGNGVMTCAGAGQRVFIDWTFNGIYSSVTDDAMPSDPSVSDKGWRARNMTLTLAGTALPNTSGFTLNFGAQVEARQAQTSTGTEGIHHYMVYDCIPTLSLGPEARKVADYDQHGKFLAGTAEALVMQFTNGTDTFQIDAPAAQRTTLGDSSRGNKLTDPIDLELHTTTSGDDQITFTETLGT